MIEVRENCDCCEGVIESGWMTWFQYLFNIKISSEVLLIFLFRLAL
jgi:hypothetical protein